MQPDSNPAPPAPSCSVTVVIPTWNGRCLLETFLSALACSTLRPEVLVVDNGSTVAQPSGFLRNHAEVKLIRQRPQQGLRRGREPGHFWRPKRSGLHCSTMTRSRSQIGSKRLLEIGTSHARDRRPSLRA